MRPWWRGSVVFLVCLILAGIAANMVIRTPTTVGGGAGMMFVVVVLAVIFKATFQYFMSRRRKLNGEKRKRAENHVA